MILKPMEEEREPNKQSYIVMITMDEHYIGGPSEAEMLEVINKGLDECYHPNERNSFTAEVEEYEE